MKFCLLSRISGMASIEIHNIILINVFKSWPSTGRRRKYQNSNISILIMLSIFILSPWTLYLGSNLPYLVRSVNLSKNLYFQPSVIDTDYQASVYWWNGKFHDKFDLQQKIWSATKIALLQCHPSIHIAPNLSTFQFNTNFLTFLNKLGH